MKEKFCQSVLRFLEQKITTARQSIFSIQEARNNETKSSVGDKHETSRSMLQIELDKQNLILQHLLKQKFDIQKVQKTKVKNVVGFGSWVETNQGNYFISVAIGKIASTFCISLASPLGKSLSGLKTGESVYFKDKEYKIKSLQ